MLVLTAIVALSAALLVLSRLVRGRRSGLRPARLDPVSTLNVHLARRQSRSTRSALQAATGLLH
jgi:hypothetical protein